MKWLNVVIKIIGILMVVFMLFAFVASFSFNSMFYNKKDDSLIIIKNDAGISQYTYSKKNQTKSGVLDINHNGIILLDDNKEIGTLKYNHNKKELYLTGDLLKNKYNNEKFEQVESIYEYLKAIF